MAATVVCIAGRSIPIRRLAHAMRGVGGAGWLPLRELADPGGRGLQEPGGNPQLVVRPWRGRIAQLGVELAEAVLGNPQQLLESGQ